MLIALMGAKLNVVNSAAQDRQLISARCVMEFLYRQRAGRSLPAPFNLLSLPWQLLYWLAAVAAPGMAWRYERLDEADGGSKTRRPSQAALPPLPYKPRKAREDRRFLRDEARKACQDLRILKRKVDQLVHVKLPSASMREMLAVSSNAHSNAEAEEQSVVHFQAANELVGAQQSTAGMPLRTPSSAMLRRQQGGMRNGSLHLFA